MTTRQYTITGRLKENEMFYAKPADFAVDGGVDVSPRTLLDEPGWSPYSVQQAEQSVAFVHLPGMTDLAEAAFVHVTQYREADRLAIIPFTEFKALGAGLPEPRLIWIFSMGRCGTTLASRVLNGSDRVWSLSEPAIFDGRALKPQPGGELTTPELIDLGTRFWSALMPGIKDTLAIKLRSQALYRADAFHAATPDARFVFMYRDAEGWVESFHQFVQTLGGSARLDRSWRDRMWGMLTNDGPIEGLAPYVDLDGEEVGLSSVFAAGWIVHLEAYRRYLHAGIPFMALRYNELNGQRAEAIEKLFRHCGLPAEGIPRAMAAFQRDSQEGTSIERNANRARLVSSDFAALRATLAKNSAYADPDSLVPDIYG